MSSFLVNFGAPSDSRGLSECYLCDITLKGQAHILSNHAYSSLVSKAMEELLLVSISNNFYKAIKEMPINIHLCKMHVAKLT